jgi:hypothetical protein
MSARGISHLNSVLKESTFRAVESTQKPESDWVALPKKREDMHKRNLFFYQTLN